MALQRKKAPSDVHKRLQQPRLCEGCGRKLKQKYFKLCTYCQKQRKKQKKEEKELVKTLKQALRT